MISVCMATYNGERFIKDQVDSILSQLKDDDELIISDDGSNDNTIACLLSYNDERIKIFQNTGMHGVNANFTNALKYARGEYIFLSDQDDVWMPDKIEQCCRELAFHYCVVHDAFVTDKDLNIICDSFFKERNSGSGFIKNLIKNTYLGCCMAFRKELLESCLPVPATTSFFHDNWIGSIADLKYDIKFLPYKGILFRRHSNNTSDTAKKSRYSRTKQIKNRIFQLRKVIERVYF